MIFSKLRSNPYTASVITALTWVPVAVFFVDHGFSYATVSGRSMQVKKKFMLVSKLIFLTTD
jgi:inner membrane protease subunit 2